MNDPPKFGEWQPIDTAPHETAVLVTDGNDVYTVVTARALSAGVLFEPHGWGAYEWKWNFDRNAITHWMPLPEPP